MKRPALALAPLAALAACGAASTAPSPSAEPPGAAPSPSAPDASAAPPAPGPALPGANVGPSGVDFSVWAPHASAAWVEGDFPEAKVALAPRADGVYASHVSGARAGSRYHFVLASNGATLARLDPYCRELDGDQCVVVDPRAYPWKIANFARPPREGAIVYELHVGSFAVPQGASQGTLASARARLAELADLGVNVVELMPVQDFGGGGMGWGYNPQLVFAPKPDLGTPDDLRAFIDEAHRVGIAVWLDVVVNHMDGWSKAPLACFDGDCPTGTSGIYFFGAGPYARTPWGPRPDYTSPHVTAMLLGWVDEWLGNYRGDGFRWDSVSNIRALDGQGTTPGGRDLLVVANAKTHAAGGFSVAEDLKGYAAITQPADKNGFAFDAQWDGFGYAVTGVLAGASDDARDLGALQGALTGAYAGDAFARLLFLEDHDTVGNGGARLPVKIDAANPASDFARERSMLGGVLLMTAPGVPMLFMGEESLAAQGFTSPPAPLAAPSAVGAQVRAFYKDMIRLRRDLDGGAAGLLGAGIDVFHRNDTAKVLAFRRFGAQGGDVIVVLNLRNKAYAQYDIGVPDAGPWRVRLGTDRVAYGAAADGQTGALVATATPRDGKPYTLSLQLGAYEAIVLTR